MLTVKLHCILFRTRCNHLELTDVEGLDNIRTNLQEFAMVLKNQPRRKDGKHNAQIIWSLAVNGCQTIRQLYDALWRGTIVNCTITRRINKKLEPEKYISKIAVNEGRTKFRYRLTSKGIIVGLVLLRKEEFEEFLEHLSEHEADNYPIHDLGELGSVYKQGASIDLISEYLDSVQKALIAGIVKFDVMFDNEDILSILIGTTLKTKSLELNRQKKYLDEMRQLDSMLSHNGVFGKGGFLEGSGLPFCL